ncbi:hypothetical protein CJ030_MR8G016805 [Morella rubra]|uniref:Uncharacterized protein n=1 Tax=Morella rubra TaxID=262757 RepID=A0A6A1UU77_9ROSI|nr:hypothetical protein CJ030_MR8G016805 [Morella rubra]
MHPSGDETVGRPACFAGENGGFSRDYDKSADSNCKHCEKCDSSSSYSYSSAAFDSIPLKDSEKLPIKSFSNFFL